MSDATDPAEIAASLSPNIRCELLKFVPVQRRAASSHSTACLFAKAAKLGLLEKRYGYPVGYEMTLLGEAVRAELEKEAGLVPPAVVREAGDG